MTKPYNKILVIDDRKEEVQDLIDALWGELIPVHFCKYDPPLVLRIEKQDFRHSGIRAILQDINLHGDSDVGTDDYAAAMRTIKALLDNNNGPWLLITWSSHHNKASELFDFLRERMPKDLRPIAYEVLNKEDYHNGEGGRSLHDDLYKIFDKYPAFNTLRFWEGVINKCTSEVIRDLSLLPQEQHSDEFNMRLCELLDLLSSSMGNADNTNMKLFALNNILSELLKDKVDHFQHNRSDINCTLSNTIHARELKLWKRRINLMLNLEWGGKFLYLSPGSIYKYPSSRVQLDFPKYKPKERRELIIEEFLNKNKLNDQNREEILSDITLMCIDVTPPCDHANNKLRFRKFVSALHIPIKHTKMVKKLSKTEEGYLLESDEYVEDSIDIYDTSTDEQSGFFFLINSRMYFSIPDTPELESKFRKNKFYKGRFKEIYLLDMLGYLGRQLSRSGHTSLRT